MAHVRYSAPLHQIAAALALGAICSCSSNHGDVTNASEQADTADAGCPGSGGSSSGSGNGSDSGDGPTLAAFAFVVDGVAQRPLACPAANWEFSPPPDQIGYPSVPSVCNAGPPCSGLSSAVIKNSGPVPLAYTAQATWSGPQPPGVNFGNAYELSGVLQPGEQVDILPVYIGGVTAVLGASLPFSDAGKFASDEGTIPWPAGVPGSGGATTMHVSQITVLTACQNITPEW